MKKLAIVIMTSLILLGYISGVYAADILGYPIVEKQAKFYTIILGVIAASIALVSAAYVSLWLADARKKTTAQTMKVKKEAFGGGLAVAAQSGR